MKLSRYAILVSLALFFTVDSPASAGPIALGRTVKKPSIGFSMRVPEGWGEIPPEPNDPVVARFRGTGAVESSLELHVCQFKRIVKPVEGYGPPTKPSKDLFGPKSVEDYLKRMSKQLTGASPLKIGDVDAGLYEFAVGNTMVLAASVPHADGEFGVVFYADARFYKRDYRPAYLQAIKSFRLISESEAATRSRAPAGSREAIREEKHDQVRDIPGWYYEDTENYVILSNCPDKSLIKQIESDLEKIRKDVYEVLFPPAKPITALSVVRVCSTQEEYHRYGGPPGTGGYWNDESEELVFFWKFANQSKKKSRKNSLAVLYHEAFHQYIYYSVGNVAPHSWFNEGHGDFFAGSVKVGGRFEVRPFDWRVNVVKVAASTGKLVPLKKLLYYSQREYYANAGQNYAQGWAFIYFLRKVTKKPAWTAILDVYFNYLKDHLPKEEAKPVAEKTTPPSPPTGDGPGTPPPPTPPSGDGSGATPPTPPADPSGGEAKPADPNAPPSGGDDEEEEDEGPPPPPAPGKDPKSEAEKRVLKEAVDRALEGIDLDELEKAFVEWVKRL